MFSIHFCDGSILGLECKWCSMTSGSYMMRFKHTHTYTHTYLPPIPWQQNPWIINLTFPWPEEMLLKIICCFNLFTRTGNPALRQGSSHAPQHSERDTYRRYEWHTHAQTHTHTRNVPLSQEREISTLIGLVSVAIFSLPSCRTDLRMSGAADLRSHPPPPSIWFLLALPKNPGCVYVHRLSGGSPVIWPCGNQTENKLFATSSDLRQK